MTHARRRARSTAGRSLHPPEATPPAGRVRAGRRRPSSIGGAGSHGPPRSSDRPRRAARRAGRHTGCVPSSARSSAPAGCHSAAGGRSSGSATRRASTFGRMSSVTDLPLRTRVTGSSSAARARSTRSCASATARCGTSTSQVQESTDSCRLGAPGSTCAIAWMLMPGGSVGFTRRDEHVDVDEAGRHGARLEVDVEVLATGLVGGGQGEAEAEPGAGREALAVGHRQSAPTEAALPHAGHVAVGGEADASELLEADADPLGPGRGHRWLPAGAARDAGRELDRDAVPTAQIHARALAAAGGRGGRGDDVLDAVAGAGAAVVARGPAAVGQADLGEGVLPVHPEEVLVQAGGEVVPGQDLVLGAVPVDVPVGVEAALGHGVEPQALVEVLAPLLEHAAAAPDRARGPGRGGGRHGTGAPRRPTLAGRAT